MKYCIECGNKLIIKRCICHGVDEGNVPFCEKCGEFRFPLFNTAVSMVVFNHDYSKILLIKQYGRDRNILVAGYVNKGECLEQALKRELKEEVNLDLISYKFNASQYFEKSNSLICNFMVQAKGEVKLTQEVDYAAWYSIEEAKSAIAQNSLAQQFLELAISKI